MSEGSASQASLERARAEAARELANHEIECERRYGEINSSLDKLDALQQRNTRLLYVILTGMLAVVMRSFWPAIFGG